MAGGVLGQQIFDPSEATVSAQVGESDAESANQWMALMLGYASEPRSQALTRHLGVSLPYPAETLGSWLWVNFEGFV